MVWSAGIKAPDFLKDIDRQFSRFEQDIKRAQTALKRETNEELKALHRRRIDKYRGSLRELEERYGTTHAEIASTIEKIRNAVVTPPTRFNARIPADLERIVLRALSKDLDHRYQTAGEFWKALKRALHGDVALVRAQMSDQFGNLRFWRTARNFNPVMATAAKLTLVECDKLVDNGAIELTVHANGSLIKHPDILRAVSTGQVNIGEFLLGQFGNEDPVFAADNVPFVAAGYDNAWKFYQAQKPSLEKSLEKRGLKLLYSVAWPGQGFYTKEPLKSVDDLKGTKFRTYSPLTARLAELLGASPTVIQVPEIPQMFATNKLLGEVPHTL